jgi:hypothetical protein
MKRAIAIGSLSTLPSLMMTPRSSMMQMLELSSETSIPTKNSIALHS